MKKATLYDYARMCKKYIKGYCKDCSLYSFNNEIIGRCRVTLQIYTDEANEIILKWCDEHPIGTRQNRFLKMFSNAEINKDGIIEIFPCNIEKNLYISDCCSCSQEHSFSGCGECRKRYWFAEVDENE